LDVGNPGNDGYDKEGDPIVLKWEQTYNEEKHNFEYDYVEHESDRGQTAQRIEALANGSLTGDHLVTQVDLRDAGVLGAKEACHFLAVISGPQIEKNEYYSISKVKALVDEYKADGALRASDLNVEDPITIMNSAARDLGFRSGRAGTMGDKPSSDASGSIRRGISNSGSGLMHSNFGDSSGRFVWESWNGGSNRIDNPVGYYSLYWR
jgi:hypothetical protein